MELFTKCI